MSLVCEGRPNDAAETRRIILDAVDQAGYFDQPHMTRSLKHYIGLTPGQIIDQGRARPRSFLYNTAPINPIRIR